jgi:hypothetical protein
VTEVWRYDGNTCLFYARFEEGYSETRVSRFLPGLTGAMIADAIEVSNPGPGRSAQGFSPPDQGTKEANLDK